jgi:hypothetical protein
MLPDEPDRAKGDAAVAAKKVCKATRREASGLDLQRRGGLVRGLQGLSAVVAITARNTV